MPRHNIATDGRTRLIQVMHGLVHGDSRSHAILSPWSVVAGANHVCESIAIAINTALADHGNLPRTASVQLDNASVNHNSLVLGFLALYVLFGVFDWARLRFELENHAHDIYDAFQAIHQKRSGKVNLIHAGGNDCNH